MKFNITDKVQMKQDIRISSYPNAMRGTVTKTFRELPGTIEVKFEEVSHPILVLEDLLEKRIIKERPTTKYCIGDTVRIQFGDDCGKTAIIEGIREEWGNWGYSLEGKNVSTWVLCSWVDEEDRLELIPLPEAEDALDTLRIARNKAYSARTQIILLDAVTCLKAAIESETAKINDFATTPVS